MICGLKSLETLELDSQQVNNSSGLGNLHKLRKLKRLKASFGVSPNILDHLKFGAYTDLEELYGCFKGASMESVQEMNRIARNLRKLEIYAKPGHNQCFAGNSGEPGSGEHFR
jgi:hypothetical protein